MFKCLIGLILLLLVLTPAWGMAALISVNAGLVAYIWRRAGQPQRRAGAAR
jgi:hypothetical protein